MCNKHWALNTNTTIIRMLMLFASISLQPAHHSIDWWGLVGCTGSLYYHIPSYPRNGERIPAR